MSALRIYWTCMALAAVSGCAQLAPVRERIVSGVKTYCDQPHAERLLLRQSVNASLAPAGASITVTCAGDPAGDALPATAAQ